MRDVEELIKRAQEGDKEAKDRMISENLGLVHSIVRRFEHRGCEREELFQTGCIGLIKAIEKFDLSLQLAFSTYAVPMIMGEIRRFLRDDGMVKVSRTLKENGYKISKARELLTRELGREPSLLEIEALTELSREEIVLALEANREVESIYQPVAGSEGEELLLVDQLGNARNGCEDPEKEALLNGLLVEQLMKNLNEIGRYSVPADLKKAIDREFWADFAGDEETAATVKAVWENHGYLCDTHTAVGWYVAEHYVNETGDHRPMVVLSTASPYKFPASVLTAIGGDTSGDEFQQMETLSTITGVPIPGNLAGLKELEERHTGVIPKENMLSYVLGE